MKKRKENDIDQREMKKENYRKFGQGDVTERNKN